jgi:hypothetical protein
VVVRPARELGRSRCVPPVAEDAARGIATPAPAQLTRAPFSAVSAPPGLTITGVASASALVTVPWPPPVIASAARGITCA